jgi:hypothetical protein
MSESAHIANIAGAETEESTTSTSTRHIPSNAAKSPSCLLRGGGGCPVQIHSKQDINHGGEAISPISPWFSMYLATS